MRVISGERKRYVLKTPKGDKIRPTSDKIKETLFNIIDDLLYDKVFLDLFSGTGQIGIEALSRGAKQAIFIDSDKQAIKLITDNVEHVEYKDISVIIHGYLPGSIKKAAGYTPNIIFMDPPYKIGIYESVFNEIKNNIPISEDLLIIAEASKEEDFSFLSDLGFYIEKEKIYKNQKHIFVRSKYE